MLQEAELCANCDLEAVLAALHTLAGQREERRAPIRGPGLTDPASGHGLQRITDHRLAKNVFGARF